MEIIKKIWGWIRSRFVKDEIITIIVTKDGCIHIEQLDESTIRWFQGIIDQISSSTSRGWDNRSLRSGSVRCVWGNMAQKDVLAEIYTADASIRVYRHQLLPSR